MRRSVRAVFAGTAAFGLLAIGASPALAAKGEKSSDDDSTVTAAAEGGKGGKGGHGGFGVNVCPSVALLAPAKARCDGGNGGNANGGDAEAYAEDDSKDRKYSKDDD
ncbi:hypothetical protein [Saccharopolyspora phatthalungensis]|uniref:DUF320 domain-containing protein n=1 Tax=Saccharopolyspora phatthalungensis TaxID=664693 RepID=A0A840Q5E0_9PSEU|nr:hypothetical protein [Saccharopolyspora phatthalungensis]MBB5154901.1 hypothetical protein [Saccharopolyspora phatthalungensis]